MVIFVIFAFLFGACLGSFLNVVILRLPKDESLWRRGSHCFSCEQPIPWYHNIPILSYFILRGRCSKCGARFSVQYVIVEFVTAVVLALLALYRFHGALPLLPYEPVDWFALRPEIFLFLRDALLFLALFSITVIDARHYIIPLEITLTTLLLGLLLVFLQPALLNCQDRFELVIELLLSALAGGVLFWIVRIVGGFVFKREALGLGDVHLMFMLIPFLNWQQLLLVIFLASIIGCVGGVAMKIFQRREIWRFEVPFGPYLALAALTAYFFGANIINFYKSLIFR